MSESIVLGGGCFWCTEAVFKMLKGVSSVLPGYAGGATANPTYDQVCSGKTGHAEVIKIDYDSTVIKLEDLLNVFFATHDPTTLNRQGHDVGTQYRSVIFYQTEKQQQIVVDYLSALNTSSTGGAPIVTEIKPLDVFYPAETYHQDYFSRNQDNAYCQAVINPKLSAAKKAFAKLMVSGKLSSGVATEAAASAGE